MAGFRVQSGRMRREITFLKKIKQGDTMGGGSIRLESVRTDRSYLYPTSSREATLAQARNIRTTHVMECRFFEGLDANWVIQDGKRFFAIVGIQNVDERDRKWLIDCEEGLPKEIHL